jgi:hypothetical protein
MDTEQLRNELLRQWEFNHKERCRGDWPHIEPCFWELPSAVASLSKTEVCQILGRLSDRAV